MFPSQSATAAQCPIISGSTWRAGPRDTSRGQLQARGRRVPAINILPTFTIVLLINHYSIEGWRWQMIPLYIITIFTFLVTLPNFLKKKGEDVDSAPRPGWPQR